MTTYETKAVADIPADLMRDLATDCEFAVVRTSPRGAQVWSFHKTAKLADAACRRNRMRDVVTR